MTINEYQQEALRTEAGISLCYPIEETQTALGKGGIFIPEMRAHHERIRAV